MSKLRISLASAAAATALLATGVADAQSLPQPKFGQSAQVTPDGKNIVYKMGASSIFACTTNGVNDAGLKDLTHRIRDQYIAEFKAAPSAQAYTDMGKRFAQYARNYPNVVKQFEQDRAKAMAAAQKEAASKRFDPAHTQALSIAADVSVMAGFMAVMEMQETIIGQTRISRLKDFCVGRLTR